MVPTQEVYYDINPCVREVSHIKQNISAQWIVFKNSFHKIVSIIRILSRKDHWTCIPKKPTPTPP